MVGLERPESSRTAMMGLARVRQRGKVRARKRAWRRCVLAGMVVSLLGAGGKRCETSKVRGE